MILFRKAVQLSEYLAKKQASGIDNLLIPTMGALHPGHISLLNSSKAFPGLRVCSIFVNPTQFNDPSDFKKYPVTLENDIRLLEQHGADILFLPDVAEMYPDGMEKLEQYELGYLESVLEGRFRPGHFQGVCQIMQRLLSITKPRHLFMGQKDYQQCMVVSRLLTILKLGTELHTVPTLRETGGLAMSSRNIRLSPQERKNALAIYQSLCYLRDQKKPGKLEDQLLFVRKLLEANEFQIDYAVIADSRSLETVDIWDGKQPIVALIAAFQHEVRLIDNMLLFES